MQPTKCHRIAGYVITDSVQLEFLKRYFLYKRVFIQQNSPSSQREINTCIKKRKQIKQAMKEGIEHQSLVKRKELYAPYIQYPDVVVELEERNYYFSGLFSDTIKAKEKGSYKEIEKMPENLPSFKLVSIREIIDVEKEDENVQLYSDKQLYITVEISSNNKYFLCSCRVLIKEDQYICVERVLCDGFEPIDVYMKNTRSYQQMLIHQFFERKIDLALSGNGDLMKYKDLPVITMPLEIKEK